MEHQCSKCGKAFHPSSKITDVCGNCLEEEFSSTGKDQVDTAFREEVIAQLDDVRKRQRDRAELMNQSYNSGNHFTTAGKVNAIVAGFLILICIFILLINNKENTTSGFFNLDDSKMRIFTMIFCFVAACFLFKASIRHKKLFRIAALLVLLFGWFAPDLASAIKKTVPLDDNDGEATIEQEQRRTVTAIKGRLLNEDDLETLRLRRSESHNMVYGFFLNNADPLQRNNLLDAFARLTTASYKALYSKKRGYLIIIETPTRQLEDMTAIAKQFGELHYHSVEDGIYEVNYSSEISRMTNSYSPEAITTPTHPSFVNANIEELLCKVPDRVYQAAIALKTANSPLLRIDVVDKLLEVLQDNWSTEPQAHTALVDALITYSAPNNERTADEAQKLFNSNHINNIQTPVSIIDYLLNARGEEMSDSIIQLWMKNPIVWHNQLSKLGPKTERKLLSLLDNTRDLQLIGNVLKYLKSNGTDIAIPYIDKFTVHPDSLVSRTAKSTIEAIKSRY